MKTEVTMPKIAWVTNYPAHYFRVLHCRVESETPSVRFLYLAPPEMPSDRAYEVGELPKNSTIIPSGDVRALLVALEEYSPEVLFINGHSPAELKKATRWAWSRGVKVCYISDTNFSNVEREPLLKRVARWVYFRMYLRRMWRLLYMGTSNRKYYEWCCGKSFVAKHAMFFPLPLEAESSTPHVLPIESDGRLLCLYLGRLAEAKSVDNLIRAVALVPEHLRQRFRCVVVGDGPCRESLEALTQTLKVTSTVEFAGSVASDKRMEYFQAADIFVLPSKDEAWGLVIQEALASSVAVITARNVGASQDLVIDGKTGFLLQTNSPGEISAALCNWLKEPDCVRLMGETGRLLIDQGKWSIAGTLEAWRTLVAQVSETANP